MPPRFLSLFFKIFTAITLLALAGGMSSAKTAELPVQEETLGAWHYLVPLEMESPTYPAPKYPREVFVPTVVSFAQGKREAVLLPGSSRVAEFREGKFFDLKWPPLFLPLSLAADADGRLCCLFKKRAEAKDDWAEGPQWVTFLEPGRTAWSSPIEVPMPSGDLAHVDHIEFDSHHRLWTLGPCGKVAVLGGGGWDAYTYSDDAHLHFAPVRFAEEANGDITLFSNWQDEANISHLLGTLTYHAGKFSHDPAASAQSYVGAEWHKEGAMHADPFDRSTGYVCHTPQALNRPAAKPLTVLTTADYTLISLGNQGLTWARKADLEQGVALSEDADWEGIDDVIMAPAIDPTGVMWLWRDNPSRLIRIGQDKTEEFPGLLEEKSHHDFTLFDQKGRPWFLAARWRDNDGGVVVFDQGFHEYASLEEALHTHAADYKSGAVFAKMRETDRYGEGPGVLKTPQGQICLGGPQFETFTILGGDKDLHFKPDEINPAQASNEGGHGYNPFSNGEPRLNTDGDVTTCVDNIVYRYHGDQWIPVGNYVPPEGIGVPSDAEVKDPLATRVTSSDGRIFVFRGFHFYEKTANGLVQIDQGLNPLAFYPFWKGWYESPGMTMPRIDPTGRIWVSSIGPYSGQKAPYREDKTWQVLRKPVSGK